MIKYCVKKWDKNKDKLKKVLEKDTTLNVCDYNYLLKLVVENILNDENSGYSYTWDSNRITIIDNGDYQGTLLFLIPNKTYQPCEYDYLMTYVGYGSCSGCDTLQAIQSWHGDKEPPTKEQLKDFMLLCKDMVCNMIKPYNEGWRNNTDFEPVKEKDVENGGKQ
ncbi:MAG: hypothetical protein IKY14_04010 [Erysipelotrichaceae bacterium]|nr:hypothetical protein [Erysipelotrichaceae bacterium]